ncbi:MAG TPA: polyphosphate polymerase domain-containing protein [Verrucomicrobiota bacterium]|nr:polyphosphate polymerase domain-containing protein [Verrucomicrobiota bacterium]
MIPSLPHLRYEKKFIAEGRTLAEVLARVRLHPSAFREVYPPRTVNNVYLDSPARRDYHNHINGTADRSKTRVRWYGEQFETADGPRLERKLKRGMVSGKEAHPLPALSISRDCIRSGLNTAFETASIPPLLRSSLRHVEPALFNRYRRHYFLSRDGKFRLTVDSHLQFAAAHNNHGPALASSLPLTILILELKFDPDAAESADAITNALPFRLARFSKYVTGIEGL